ncbi:MAG TPA: sugar transferase [Ktedonobacterales bacterium]
MAQEHMALLTDRASATTGVLEREHPALPQADGVAIALPLRELPLGYRIAKRTLDLIVSATILLLLSPLLGVVALIIKLTSPGPALFSQQRVGEGGRIFTMYKFRSMCSDADHSLHQIAYTHFVQGKGGNGKVTKESLALAGRPYARSDMDDDAVEVLPMKQRGWLRLRLHRLRPLLHAEDPRITPVGALIRITSIDELPQLYNVLTGDMTLVGPRPPIPYEVRLYQHKHLQRLTVRPGVTGIWQIYGRNKVPFEQMVDMDLEYIKRRSFWLDLKLILITAPAVLLSRAAK